MNKLYNTQENLARDLARFFQKVTKIKKPQLKIIPYIILGMIESESVRRLERFFNHPKFDIYQFYHEIISHVISNYTPKNKEIHICMDHMYCRDDFTILVFSIKIDKQRHTIVV